MPSNGIKGKDGEEIEVGDSVSTPFRGGKREGRVEAVIHDQDDLENTEGIDGVAVKNLPKVVFADQHGHRVSHNPGTLSHSDGSD